jgi:hypothetical protein
MLGALTGFSVRQLFFVKYQARISLPLSGDLATFGQAEALFSSPAIFKKYGVKQKISHNGDFEQIYQQFASNLGGPIKIEHAFRLLRKDVRDLPDIPKDELNRQLGFPQGVQSDVQVYATAGEPETAIRLAKLAMGYARDCLAAATFNASLQQWGPAARAELAANWTVIAKLQSDLASSNRLVESMERLRGRFKDERDLSSGSAPVQVQVTGARNLSPFQQLIGLETDRANLIEKLRSAELDRLRLETLVRFSDLFDSRFGDGAAIDLAKEALSHAKQSETSLVGDQTKPLEEALASIALRMQTILSRFDETRTDPIEPAARSVGIGRGLAVLLGLVVAAAAWLLLVLILPAPRSKSEGMI